MSSTVNSKFPTQMKILKGHIGTIASIMQIKSHSYWTLLTQQAPEEPAFKVDHGSA